MKQLRAIIELHFGTKYQTNDPRKKSSIYLRSNKSLQFLNQLQFLQTKLNSLIKDSGEKYYVCLSEKLLDPQTSPKSYWPLLKTFLNNKKIPCIPTLFTPR